MVLDPKTNPYGAGVVAETNVIKVSTALDLDVNRHRVFKMRNDKIINGVTKKPIAYKILTAPTQMLLTHPSVPFHRRCAFGTRPVWITEYRDGEIFPNGEFTPQAYRDDDIKTWVDRQDSIVDKDVVFWHSEYHIPNPTLRDLRHSVRDKD
ncbi:copper amine oxidase [Ilyonectria robusta]